VNTQAFFAIGTFTLILALLLVLGLWLERRARHKPAAIAPEDILTAPPERGYLKVAEIRGVSLRIHWSLPAAALLIAAYAGFKLREAAYFYIGYLVLVVVHELGHVAAATFLGLKVFSIEFSGIGGQIRLHRSPSGVGDTFLVYSAGVFAQLALLVLTVFYLAVFSQPTTLFGRCLVLTFTAINLVVIAINFIPAGKPHIVATDGYVLWKLLLHVWKKAPHPLAVFTAPSPVFSPDTRLASLQGFLPDSFVVGVEILNDNSTPMEFVVRALMKHLQLERNNAIELMLAIHQKGGALVPLPSLEKAEAVATGVARDAQAHSHSLVCRVVDTQR